MNTKTMALPTAFLSPRTHGVDMMGISPRGFAIGVDIGGTEISAGVVASDGQLARSTTTVPTPLAQPMMSSS